MAPKRSSSKLGRRPSVLPVKKTLSKQSIKRSESSVSGTSCININRAPVLTLWMDVSLRRLGNPTEVALTAAKVITGWCAQAKGKSLGIIRSSASTEGAPKKKPAAKTEHDAQVKIAGQVVPLAKTSSGMCAVSGGKPVDPSNVSKYLCTAFGTNYDVVRSAMEKTAKSYPARELESHAMDIYERFRPSWKGWGVKGQLHLKDIAAAGK
mmetsp:Transcript_73226/g.115878  ORF Transcript_73226/g.115878 Transcript_73226/m.115878 type:complete len:209 (-) Transcript_73226:94-720(-)